MFVEGENIITFVNSDGSGKEQPQYFDTNATEFERIVAPSISPDGKYLAVGGTNYFHSDNHLYIVDLQTNQITIASDWWNELTGIVSWSPASNRMAFVTRIPGDAERVIIWGISTYQTQLTSGRIGGLKYDLYPSWSPDGRYIAFVRMRDIGGLPSKPLGEDFGSLCIVRPDGSEMKVLVEQILIQGQHPNNLEYVGNTFAWSPDGQWIAYLAGDTIPDIAIVNVETGETRVLAPSPAKDLNPDWLPDGTRLAFASNRNGRDEIFTVSLDGSTLTNLTLDAPSDYFSPVWSPSGNYIAYLSGTGSEVWVMSADGSHRILVGNSHWRPVWLPTLTP